MTPNQNTENVNDLVMKDRLNSLKNGGNNITKESLKNCKDPFDKSNNYQKVLRFGNQ